MHHGRHLHTMLAAKANERLTKVPYQRNSSRPDLLQRCLAVLCRLGSDWEEFTVESNTLEHLTLERVALRQPGAFARAVNNCPALVSLSTDKFGMVDCRTYLVLPMCTRLDMSRCHFSHLAVLRAPKLEYMLFFNSHIEDLSLVDLKDVTPAEATHLSLKVASICHPMPHFGDPEPNAFPEEVVERVENEVLDTLEAWYHRSGFLGPGAPPQLPVLATSVDDVLLRTLLITVQRAVASTNVQAHVQSLCNSC